MNALPAVLFDTALGLLGGLRGLTDGFPSPSRFDDAECLVINWQGGADGRGAASAPGTSTRRAETDWKTTVRGSRTAIEIWPHHALSMVRLEARSDGSVKDRLTRVFERGTRVRGVSVLRQYQLNV